MKKESYRTDVTMVQRVRKTLVLGCLWIGMNNECVFFSDYSKLTRMYYCIITFLSTKNMYELSRK